LDVDIPVIITISNGDHGDGRVIRSSASSKGRALGGT
jgi:hypothetical protein